MPGETSGLGSAGSPTGESGGEILVTAERPRGSVTSEIPAERAFQPLDIRAFGVNNLEELLQTIGPQVSSDRGREDNGPVVLLNGRRVSSLAEIAKIPTEAIERMEVFPEEVALSYGYPADQKVVNVILFARFTSEVGQLSYAAPTDGGRYTPGAAASFLRIMGSMRVNVDGEYSRSGALLESERDLTQLDGLTEVGRFRTLLPRTERIALNGTVSGSLIDDISTTLNGSFDKSSSRTLLGLGGAGPLSGDADTHIGHIGTTLGGQAGTWQWTLTGNYDRARIDTVIDGSDLNGARNEARSVNAVAEADLILVGKLLDLPAGPVSMSVQGGVDLRDFSSRSLVGGVERRLALSRDRGAAQASLDVPLASRINDGIAWLGSLSLNANLRLEELSDFGTLRTYGYGLNWSPIPSINVVASATHEEGAPTVEQLGGPTIVTPNVRTFDFRGRETVEVTRLFGGNPALRSDDRRVVSVGLTARPVARTDFTITADYLRTRIDDPIAAFPVATPQLEAAFPERFVRGADDRLLRIDARPTNFERSDQEQLRFGLNFARPLGEVAPELRDVRVRFAQDADVQRRIPAGGSLTKVAPGSAEMRRVETLTSRLYVSAFYTVRLKDEIRLGDGAPTLDLLDGSAIDVRGGRARHEVEFQAGASKRGLGVRVSAVWQSGTRVAGLDGADDDLRFSDYGTINVNLFANLADRFGGPQAPAWIKGTRISIGVANLLNERPEVRDAAGATPINYQAASLNPIGRVINFSLRKIF
ncbi:TonB-dependent receptor domain-containing protein [uncultured Sphingomonas sp.]|uniref:TonB-dependent receptor domain-containing protein n=1 Tax=uncultured Sphingomonas sp. TaxID=158754 RepID=UPI0035CBD11F